ncbi:MAG TPA: rhodanese-like domain-containing protein [Pseudonocardiaceae bacterium]|jgi:rhodanese-related sulfurtransferase
MVVMPQVPTVSLHQLPESDAGLLDGVLLDVREDDEWAAGHAPHAVHLPMGELPGRLDEVPSDGTLYVICRSGGRSARVAAYLNANGWDAVNVVDGMLGWQATGRPLVAASGQPQVL